MSCSGNRSQPQGRCREAATRFRRISDGSPVKRGGWVTSAVRPYPERKRGRRLVNAIAGSDGDLDGDVLRGLGTRIGTGLFFEAVEQPLERLPVEPGTRRPREHLVEG